MWNFCLCTKKLHMLLHELLPSFRAKCFYLFVCSFILCQFVTCQHIPWDTQTILFLLGPLCSGRTGCPCLQASSSPLGKASPTLCQFIFIPHSSPLLSSTPRWGLLQLPNSIWSYTRKFCSAAGKSSLPTFWPVSRGFQVLPLDLPPWGGQGEHFYSSCGTGKVFIQGQREFGGRVCTELVPPDSQPWGSVPSLSLLLNLYRFLPRSELPHSVTSQYCAVKIPLCAFSHPVLHHFPAWLEASLPQCSAGHSAFPALLCPSLWDSCPCPSSLSAPIWIHTTHVKQQINPAFPVLMCHLRTSLEPTVRVTASPLTCEFAPAVGTERWSLIH